jgi:hypothetical protein
MRRLILLLLLSALALPALALAARSAPGDGSLVVKDANGVITLQGDGLVFGQFDRGTLTVLDYTPDSNAAPTVSGAKMKLSGGTLTVRYVGSHVRFLFPGGKYVLRFEGIGIDISAVGKGAVQVTGRGTVDDGTFAVNGSKALLLTPLPSWAFYGSLASPPLEKTGLVGLGRFS